MDSKTINKSNNIVSGQSGDISSKGNHSSPVRERDERFQSAKADDEISLRGIILNLQEWFQYLLSKWLIVLIFGLLGGALGFIYAYGQAPIYRAELSFALEDEKSSGAGGAYAALAGQFGINLGNSGGGAFAGENLLELMKSRVIIEKTLLTAVNIKNERKTLANLYIDFNNLREKWKNPELKNLQFLPGVDRKKFNLKQDSLLQIFQNDIKNNYLSVDKLDKRLTIGSVKVRSENELFSKYFAEVLVKEVTDFYVDTRTRKSSENVNILQHQADSIRLALNSAISGVALSMDANPNPNLSRQILRAPSQKRAVDVQANTAILQELVKNLEISKVTLRKETPLIQVIDTPILPLEQEKVGKLKSLIIGGLVGGFLIVMFLLVKRGIKKILAD